MDTTRWRRIEDVFCAVKERPQSEWPGLLSARCAGDAELRAEVEALLERDATAGDLLSTPWSEDAAEVVRTLAGIEDPLLGTTIDGYRVERVVASGGMGTVYQAARIAPDGTRAAEPVAIKVVRSDLDPGTVEERGTLDERLQCESELLASLDHPNIAKFLGCGRFDSAIGSRSYYVMEFLDGQAITAAADAGRLSIRRRLELFCLACDAVEHAHRNLVIHRDLKPGNVLVDASGNLRLVDFGIAKLLADTRDPRTGAVDGGAPATRMMTLEYTSPEQAGGQKATTASDVYALGVILFELLTGERPHRLAAKHPLEAARIVTETDAPLPSDTLAECQDVAERRGQTFAKLRRVLAGDLDNIVQMALRRDPARRYATVERLAADIRKYLEGRPVAARADTYRYRLRKFVARHRLPVAVGCAVVLALAIGLTTTLWQARIASAEARHSRRVADLLVDVFGIADPLRPGDRTGLDMVEQAVARVAAYPDLRPTIRADLVHALSRMLHRQGAYARAAELTTEAIDLSLPVVAEDDVLVALYRASLGLDFMRLGRFAEAEQVLRQALAVAQSRGAHKLEADVLGGLGNVLRIRGSIELAKPMIQRALDLRLADHGPDHPLVAKAWNNVAVTHWATGDLEQAAEGIQRAKAIFERQSPRDDSAIALALQNLGILHGSLQQFDQAFDYVERSLKLREERLSPHHPSVAETLYAKGHLGLEARRLKLAETALRRCIQIREIAQPGHWFIDDARSVLGEVMMLDGRPSAAEPLLQSSYERLVAANGDRHEHTVEALDRLERCREQLRGR